MQKNKKMWLLLKINVLLCCIVKFSIEAELVCDKGDLPCDTAGCLSSERWCDAAVDCADESDERYCANAEINYIPKCKELHFVCSDGTCIPKSGRCDGIKSCPDGSDENCGNATDILLEKQKSSIIQPDDNLIAARRALQWFSDQKTENGWEKETARIIVANALTNSVIPSIDDEQLLTKQLNIQVTVDLMKNNLHKMHLSRLASLVNALVATCQNPENFQGLNLVYELRKRANKLLSERRLPPLVLLTLCLVGRSERNDFTVAFNLIREKYGTDIKAIATMSLMCMVSLENYVGYKDQMANVLEEALADSLHANDTGDVYTAALALQAINAGLQFPKVKERFQERMELAKSFLMSSQLSDGSFRDVLSTYYAVPALVGSSLLDLRNLGCSTLLERNEALLTMDAPTAQSNVVDVYYSLWISRNSEIESHSMSLTVGANWTFLDVMLLAETKSSLFSFQYEELEIGKIVYSLSGIPNDAEKKLHWTLFINQLHTQEDLHSLRKKLVPYDRGVDTLRVSNEDRFVFWFKPLSG